MIEEKLELMVPPTYGGKPTLRNAHFLKHCLNNPTNLHSLPKFPSVMSITSDNNVAETMSNKVLYHGRLKPLASWDKWVENLERIHQETWKKAGILEAIKASTCYVVRHNEIVLDLAAKWCCETNSFVFSWGEASITLEDVMVLGGYSVLGVSLRDVLRMRGVEDAVESEIVSRWKRMRSSNCQFGVSQTTWMKYFMGKGGELEHVAFIVLWLSRCVITKDSYTVVKQNLFHVAILIARGTRIALAPVVLASIYKDLGLLRNKIMQCVCEGYDNGSKLVIWAPFQLVQVWAWERFPTLAPKPVSLVCGQPRLMRWHNVTRLKKGSLREEMELGGDEFLWRPYVIKWSNWELPKFYSDEEMWVVINSEVDEELLPFLRCLRVCELVGLDCVEKYLPHRVGMQFGMDQDIPDFVPRLDGDADAAWSFYQKPVDGMKLYIPHRLLEGDVTVSYYNWRMGLSPSLCHETTTGCMAIDESSTGYPVETLPTDENLQSMGEEMENEAPSLDPFAGTSEKVAEDKSVPLQEGYEAGITNNTVAQDRIPRKQNRENCARSENVESQTLASTTLHETTNGFLSLTAADNAQGNATNQNEALSLDPSAGTSEKVAVDKSVPPHQEGYEVGITNNTVAQDRIPREQNRENCARSENVESQTLASTTVHETTNGFLCLTAADNAQGNATNQDMNIAQESNVADNPIEICDEEENDDVNRLNANCHMLESWISRLEEECAVLEATVARKLAK